MGQVGSSSQGDVMMGQRRTELLVDFSVAAWNTVAKHRVFNVTGMVQMSVFVYCEADLTSGGAAMISHGYGYDTTAYAAAQTYANLVAGKFVQPAGTAGTINVVQPWVTGAIANTVNAANNFGYQIAAAALTGGKLRFVCLWTPISPDGAVTVGDGSTF